MDGVKMVFGKTNYGGGCAKDRKSGEPWYIFCN